MNFRTDSTPALLAWIGSGVVYLGALVLFATLAGEYGAGWAIVSASLNAVILSPLGVIGASAVREITRRVGGGIHDHD